MMEMPIKRQEELRARIEQLKAEGYASDHAANVARLERKIEDWPKEWADSVVFVVYGEFKLPDTDLHVPDLGITLHTKKIDGKRFDAASAMEVSVNVGERSAKGLVDAIHKINLLIGLWRVVGWGNSSFGWWCSLIDNEFGSARLRFYWPLSDISESNQVLEAIPAKARMKVEAALYWVRDRHQLTRYFYGYDLLQIYAGYWNAFECLVDAICILGKKKKESQKEKQYKVDEFLSKITGGLKAEHIASCYHEIVNSGLKEKSRFAMQYCFGTNIDHYFSECFDLEQREDQLYTIRNSINHGSINADNPEELIRVSARLDILWIILLQMFGCILHFGVPPADRFIPRRPLRGPRSRAEGGNREDAGNAIERPCGKAEEEDRAAGEGDDPDAPADEECRR